MFVTLFLAFSASAFYISASLVMKHWYDLPLWQAVSGGLFLLGLASVAEIAVLQRARFAEVVVLIIVMEITAAVLISRHVLGEQFAPRELAGIMLLLIGAVLLLWHPESIDPHPGDMADSRFDRPWL